MNVRDLDRASCGEPVATAAAANDPKRTTRSELNGAQVCNFEQTGAAEELTLVLGSEHKLPMSITDQFWQYANHSRGRLK
jgi:hypothetical protein